MALPCILGIQLKPLTSSDIVVAAAAFTLVLGAALTARLLLKIPGLDAISLALSACAGVVASRMGVSAEKHGWRAIVVTACFALLFALSGLMARALLE